MRLVETAAQGEAEKFQRYEVALQEFELNHSWTASPFPPQAYQLNALKEYLITRREQKHAVFPLSTGVGKTYLFATQANLMQDIVLIVVPRINLLEQTKEAFEKFAPLHVVKELDYKKEDPIEPAKLQVYVTTYQSLQKHYIEINFNLFDTVILDEAHNCLSEERVKMCQHIKNSRAKLSAFTATPYLLDKKSKKNGALNNVFALLDYKADGSDSPIKPLALREAIAVKANTPLVCRMVRPKELEDLRDLNIKENDITKEEIAAKLMDKPVYNLILADLYVNGKDPVSGRAYRGQKGLIFCSGIKHATNVAKTFTRELAKLAGEYEKSVDDFYYALEEKAFNKKNRSKKKRQPYVRGIFWKEKNKSMWEKAQEKRENYLAAQVLDPQGRWRSRYADNLQTDYYRREEAEFRSKPENAGMTYHKACLWLPFTEENWQNAYDHFRVIRAVYAPSDQEGIDFLGSAKCQSIIKKFKMGQSLLLAGSEMLTEGFDDPEISVILWARPTASDKVMRQGVGRGVRLNPTEPDKICTVMQLNIFNIYGKTKFAYELISEGQNIVFSFGDVEERRANQKRTSIESPHLNIPLEMTYSIADKPAKSFIEISKRRLKKKPKLEKGSNEKNPTKKKPSKPKPALNENQKLVAEKIKNLEISLKRTYGKFEKIRDSILVKEEDDDDMDLDPNTEKFSKPSKRAVPQTQRAVQLVLKRCKKKLDEMRSFLPTSKLLGGFGEGSNESTSEDKISRMQTAVSSVEGRIEALFHLQAQGISEVQDLDALLKDIASLQTDVEDLDKDITNNHDAYRSTFALPPQVKKNPRQNHGEADAVLSDPLYQELAVFVIDKEALYLKKILEGKWHASIPREEKFKKLNSDNLDLKVMLILIEKIPDGESFLKILLEVVRKGSYFESQIKRIKQFLKYSKFSMHINDSFEGKTVITELADIEFTIRGYEAELLLLLNEFGFLPKSSPKNSVSNLFSIVLKDNSTLFLMMLGLGADESCLHPAELEALKSNDKYKLYYEALIRKELSFVDEPLLHRISLFRPNVFKKLYERFNLASQTSLLHDAYAPNWSLTIGTKTGKKGCITRAHLLSPQHNFNLGDLPYANIEILFSKNWFKDKNFWLQPKDLEAALLKFFQQRAVSGFMHTDFLIFWVL